MDISAATISAVTDQVWPLVEAQQSRSLDAVYPLIFLDCLYVNVRREGRIENVALYMVLAVELDGRKDVLGHWVGDGAEGAKF